MKKTLLSCLAIITFSFGQGYTQGDRILDMQEMAHAMKDIQKGFFYNNLDNVKEGAEGLKSAIAKIRLTATDLNNQDLYDKWLHNNEASTHRTQKKIEEYCDVIIERFSDGNKRQALQVYNKISSECIKCHVTPCFTCSK